MLDYLNAEIKKRKSEIAKIDVEREELNQRRHDLDIELRTYENVRARLGSAAETETTDHSGKSATLGGTLTGTRGVKRTRLVNHWRVVLRAAVERYPAIIKTTEVARIQRAAGYDPSPSPNIRTHFHKLRKEGLYDHVDLGAVRATAAAAELLGIPLGMKSNGPLETQEPNRQTLFGGSEEETAGHANETDPAVSIRH